MTFTVAKMNNRLYRVLAVSETVAFSDSKNWILLTPDVSVPNRKVQHLKWVPADTLFDWVRTFDFVESVDE